MDYKDKMNSYYNNERLEMHKYFHVHPNPKKVLDIGCGNGTFISKLIDKKDAEIWGIELMADQAKKAEKRLNKVLTGKIESHLEDLPPQYFDVIVCNDVLEHLENPFEVLKHLKHNLSEDGILISSIPNIRYFKVLKKVLFNRDWDYEEHGVMDFTHLRFFTQKSIRKMYENLGYKILKHEGINKSKSLKLWLMKLIPGFQNSDVGYLQFATVVQVADKHKQPKT